ncbi:MAG: nucleotidyltransferase domain-containing protein [Candidatus Methanoplasma sp.]|nr:nucleotidyltransferase domain-containing protein [Candidatus Methanoplasma sp.]
MFDYAEADRVIEMAKDLIRPDVIILFGSVAKGTADDDSDVDLILVKESDEHRLIRGAKAMIALEDSNIPIDIIVYTPEEFDKERSNRYSLVSEAIDTGRVVYGSIQ